MLRYETHGLVANQTNRMKITDCVEPGSAGFNVVWDFRSLKLSHDFVGILEDPNLTKGALTFNQANTVLEEFGNYFFFDSNKSSTEQFGFMSGNGTTQIIYEKPFVKMRYPFTYGSSYVGSFNGTYNSNEKLLGNLIGIYAVEGDGMGTLMLPNDMVYSNALRVKEVKAFDQTLSGRKYDIETITYRWYVNGHRFPILVLISSSTIYPDGRTFKSSQAAYNAIALKEDKNSLDTETQNAEPTLSSFPNPYHDFINFRFNLEQESNVNLSVYDVNGRMVKVLYTDKKCSGEKHFQFSAKGMNLGTGAYIVKLTVNGNETSHRIVEL